MKGKTGAVHGTVGGELDLHGAAGGHDIYSAAARLAKDLRLIVVIGQEVVVVLNVVGAGYIVCSIVNYNRVAAQNLISIVLDFDAISIGILATLSK